MRKLKNMGFYLARHPAAEDEGGGKACQPYRAPDNDLEPVPLLITQITMARYRAHSVLCHAVRAAQVCCWAQIVVVACAAVYLSGISNNIAEYEGVVQALARASSQRYSRIVFRVDTLDGIKKRKCSAYAGRWRALL